MVYKDTWKSISYTFETKWSFNVKLSATDQSGDTDTDVKIVTIRSRPPIPNLNTSIPDRNKPNTVLLDASKSYDKDFSDDWNLSFIWYVDWEKVLLNNSNEDGSRWYYTFISKWTHNVGVEVKDLDWMVETERKQVTINSILSVDFNAYPKAIQREWYIKIIANSPEAESFEWDFEMEFLSDELRQMLLIYMIRAEFLLLS